MKPVRMRAAVFQGPGRVALAEVPVREFGADGLLLKVMACGLSRLDSVVFRHGHSRVAPPRILGHQVVGEVMAVGDDVLRFAVGDRVAVGLTMPSRFDLGYATPPQDVPEVPLEIGVELDGGLAEFLVLDGFVVKYGPVTRLPASLGWEEATLVEPLSRSCRALSQSRMAAGKAVVILGAGLLGILSGVVAALQEARLVVLVDVAEERLELARRLGFEHVLHGRGPDLTAAVRRLTGGRGADIVLSAATAPHVQEDALAMVARGGTVALLARLPDSERPISIPSNRLIDDEIRLIGTGGASAEELRVAAEMLRKGRFPWAKVNTDAYSLNQIDAALERAEELSSLHVIVLPQAG